MMQMVARTVLLTSKAPGFRKVFFEIPNTLRRSNIQWRGRSFAASVPSDSSKPQKVHMKVSKHERRTMVEAFVDEYRASNAGKFPSVSLAQQRFGGSYYTIRQIIQELEYESKMSPVSNRQEICLGKAQKGISPHSGAREEALLTEAEGVSSSDIMATCTSQSSDVEVSASVLVKIHEDQGKIEITEDVKQSFSGKLAGSKEEENASIITSQDADRTKRVELEGNRESEDVCGVVSGKLDHKEPTLERPSLWGNLKSLADGIINFWKKM